MDEEQNKLRKILEPALPAFRTAVAARRATGATDKDIETMLSEIEAKMRSLETMDARTNKRHDEDISRRGGGGHVTA